MGIRTIDRELDLMSSASSLLVELCKKAQKRDAFFILKNAFLWVMKS